MIAWTRVTVPLFRSSRHAGEVIDDVTDVLPLAGRCVKRALDIGVSVLAAVVTAPLLLLAAIAIRLDSPGPVLFRQERIGREGKPFRIVKLRTMAHRSDEVAHRCYIARLLSGQAETHDGLFKLADDPRITRVGRVLRRLSVDELPQIWNVFWGDMSLVGPRPPVASEAALYDDATRQRLRVKPGMTGLWQVSGRCELPYDEMVRLDIEYWRTWTPMRDVAILLRTPKAVLTGRGAA